MAHKNFTVEAFTGFSIIRLQAKLDNNGCRALVEEIPSLAAMPGHFIVDCESVDAFTKEWIRALMLLQMTLKKEKRELRLAGVSSGILNFLKREGMDQYFLQSRNLKEAQRDLLPTSQPKRKMDMEFLNPFLGATLRVLKVQAHTMAVPGQAFVRKPTDNLTGDISGIIGIVSETFTGSVAISFPKDTFLNIISRLLGESIHTFDKEVADGAGEITNMIFGQAKIELNEKGYGIRTALPSVVTGENHTLKSNARGPVFVIPFDSDVGKFFVEISLSA